ncbi:protein of unknown function [Alkalispirochaeta americana]|uniref:DUF2779 domain-containing protein n=1 Tax=Alkalispirochaeta americana TaxID=159291 RepID=A0A1N6UHN2_9SPIO|nr:DUF2779 domain-containing protein [Alkalispirochaeta americana]SIQ65047.1 protein of unknown function [Alkalispirochaeta americana]
MSLLTATDFHQWVRCRRQWEAGEGPLPRDMTSEVNLRETARAVATGQALFAQDACDLLPRQARERQVPPAAWVLRAESVPAEMSLWAEETAAAVARGEAFINGLVIFGGLALVVDWGYFHSRGGGWELSFFRPATGLRGIYEDEATLLFEAWHGQGFPLAGIHLRYLGKNIRPDQSWSRDEWRELFRESTLTGRAGKALKRVSRERQELQDHAAREERGLPEDYRCRQGCLLCEAPPPQVAEARYSVLTLHKGRHLGRELQARGICDIREIDQSREKALTDRQRRQISSVLSERLFIDHQGLAAFLERLQWPLFFLDFEAYSQSIPPFAGLAPYEHTPVIASLQRQDEPGKSVQPGWFACPPGEDRREEFFRWLSREVGDQGSLVVFSKPFESAMVRQLAAVAGEPERGRALVTRMVDLLEPFADFLVYHPQQCGKVSLKRVLPLFTEGSYEDLRVRDGLQANLCCTRWADRAAGRAKEAVRSLGACAAEGASLFLEEELSGESPGRESYFASLEDVCAYCAVDTRAMVDLVGALGNLLEESSS